MQWLSDALSDFADWLLESLEWLGKKIFEAVMGAIGEGFVAVADTACVSLCVQSIESISVYVANLTPLTIYIFNMFQVSHGVSLVVCAYIARFIIRRLPIIG